jgi:hypothetical protein
MIFPLCNSHMLLQNRVMSGLPSPWQPATVPKMEGQAWPNNFLRTRQLQFLHNANDCKWNGRFIPGLPDIACDTATFTAHMCLSLWIVSLRETNNKHWHACSVRSTSGSVTKNSKHGVWCSLHALIPDPICRFDVNHTSQSRVPTCLFARADHRSPYEAYIRARNTVAVSVPFVICLFSNRTRYPVWSYPSMTVSLRPFTAVIRLLRTEFKGNQEAVAYIYNTIDIV